MLNTTIEQTPALKGMGLKGELYDIVPALLKHPKGLIEIIDAKKLAILRRSLKNLVN